MAPPLLSLVVAAALAQDSLVGGTQPQTLTYPLATPGSCANCHQGFAGSATDTWRGSMMAMAMHDPMFQAALVIAEQDVPDIGEFCLRCHTPNGWLEGRCLPGNGSALQPEDWDGITCDTCHRMQLDPEGPLIGNARYTVDDSDVKRSTIGSTLAPHPTASDAFSASGELCGVCHEVSNPLFGDFPVERTYSEWAASDYNAAAGSADRKTCQDCHLTTTDGPIANAAGLPTRTVHSHTIVGANTLVPRVLARERPDLGVSAELEYTARVAEDHLADAATVEIPVPDGPVRAGIPASFTVRVTNRTGHKLPTGYPEGRRLWLEVEVTDATGRELLRSGAIDPATMVIPDDPQLRKYEARLGANGVFSYHMIEQDTILFDGRIPPLGFRPTPDMMPVGRDFAVQSDGSLANWDDAPYTVDLPGDLVAPVTVRARLWHQTTTPEFAAFLRDANVTNDAGAEWYRMWEEAGKDAPGLVAEATLELEVAPPAAPTEPDDPTAPGEDEGGGCGCDDARGAPFAALVGVTLVARRRRRAP